MPSAVFVPLTDDLGLIPLSEELLDAVNKGGTESTRKASRTSPTSRHTLLRG